MKFLPDILRLLAIINYSDNRKNITYATIQEYLTKNDVEIDQNFVELVNALDRALKYLVQNQELEDQDLEQELKKDLASFPKTIVTNIIQFWQKEKHSIFDMLQKKNSQTAKLDNLKWSVNIQTYGKQTKNMREPSCIVDLEFTDHKKPGKLIFELSKDELEEFCEELDQIEAQVNDLFTDGGEQ